MGDKAYLTGLTLLARRELTTTQLRHRLARRGHDPAAIEAAVTRLAAERSLDDTRAAGAIARTAVAVHGYGPRRVRRQLEAAGVTPQMADQALDVAFAEQDPDDLLASALARRLRGRSRIADPREFQRLYRYLVARGFEPDRVLAALRRHGGSW